MKLEGKLFFDALIASFKSAVGFRKQLNTLNAKAEAAGNGRLSTRRSNIA